MRTLVMAARGRVYGNETESEPVIVDTDSPGAVVLELGGGERLELDRVELAAALKQAA